MELLEIFSMSDDARFVTLTHPRSCISRVHDRISLAQNHIFLIYLCSIPQCAVQGIRARTGSSYQEFVQPLKVALSTFKYAHAPAGCSIRVREMRLKDAINSNDPSLGHYLYP